MNARHVLRATVLLHALAGCHGADDVVAQQSQPTVYGNDDRTDPYAASDPRAQALARSTAVALIPSNAVDARDPSHVQITGPTLGSAQNLCSDQRFVDDPSAALCSGVLIDDDLVLTAGHCLINSAECTGGISLVFGFARSDAATLATVTSDDVYHCAALVAHSTVHTGASYIDYAVIRLDRPATPRHVPAVVHRGNDPVTRGMALTCVGFPNGIPVKIDQGGTVRDPRATQGDYFLATTDTFDGNSGSGVFDTATMELRGILLDGDADYVARGSCNVVHACAEDGCSGESIGYVQHAIDGLCAVGASQRLCCPDGGPCDAGAPHDAATDATADDAGRPDATDAGDEGAAPRAGGCGCRAQPVGGGPVAVGLVLIVLALARRRRVDEAGGPAPTGRNATAGIEP